MPCYTDRRSLPPCPDPDQYILVESKEGFFWRRKRGQKTRASKNAVLQANEDLMKICSPAASRILTALQPYRLGFEAWRVQAHFTSLIRKGMKGRYFSSVCLKGAEMQKSYHLNHLLKSAVTVTQAGYLVVVQVPLRAGDVYRHSSQVSDFYLEAILVSGDPLADAPLQVENAVSPLYAFDNLPNTTCSLQLPINGKPWILLLKFCSLEGNEMAKQAKHYAMKVIEVGG
jgi:hypothetical protein